MCGSLLGGRCVAPGLLFGVELGTSGGDVTDPVGKFGGGRTFLKVARGGGCDDVGKDGVGDVFP